MPICLFFDMFDDNPFELNQVYQPVLCSWHCLRSTLYQKFQQHMIWSCLAGFDVSTGFLLDLILLYNRFPCNLQDSSLKNSQACA